ncbi:HNH endonuclease [Planococcus sp. A6]|uniref:HNH endonuclease n=1 Tax=Planococcus sp. A6 TaxID=2992760 RepID=UPI00237C0D0C|nr:HNH endonuclease [Planococcus sp. A6]MDE0582222.1 HNH endonuclease [Planococcus sp. A6]
MPKRKYDRTRTCSRCGKTFEGYPGKPRGERTFCTKECRLTQMSEDNLLKRVNQKGGLTEEEKTKIREAQINRWQKEDRPLSPDTYRKVHGRHEHRVVMERIIGRPLSAEEVVHHIDSNKHNNEPENLMLFANQAEHLNWHRKFDPRYGGGLSHD